MALRLSPTCDISSIRDIAEIDVELSGKMIALCADHIGDLRASSQEDFKVKESLHRDRFVTLLEFTLKHGLEPSEIANRLGTTSSTVLRWASGAFIPKQVFVRIAVLEGIIDLLNRQINQMNLQLSRAHSASQINAKAISDKYGHVLHDSISLRAISSNPR